jgi:hypothetical protein
MHNTSRCSEIEGRFPDLIAAILNAHKAQLAGRQAAGRKSPARKASTFPAMDSPMLAIL